MLLIKPTNLGQSLTASVVKQMKEQKHQIFLAPVGMQHVISHGDRGGSSHFCTTG